VIQTEGICGCDLGSFLNEATCTACTAPCLSCTAASGGCLKCDQGFKVDPATKNCVCLLGLYPSAATTCSACPNLCTACSSNTACTSCVPRSAAAAIALCLCLEGFWESTIYKNCEPCPYWCKACSSATVCTACNSPMTVVSDNCQCAAGLFFNVAPAMGASICTACVAQCSTCLSLAYCTACIAAFSLQGGSCVCALGSYLASPTATTCTVCPFTCAICTSGTACQYCKPSYLLNNNNLCACKAGQYIDGSNVCQPCLFPCRECSAAMTCSSCATGYTLTDSNCVCSSGFFSDVSNQMVPVCRACFSACLTCTSFNFCQTCAAGFTPSSNRCVCPAGRFLSVLAAAACIPCPTTCATCLADTFCVNCVATMFFVSNSYVCSCRAATYYDSANNRCGACSGGCVNCISAAVCISCSKGYIVINTVCTCIGPNFYNTSITACSPCSANCQACTSAVACVSCIEGYYISNGACVNCAAGCFRCSAANICTLCSSTLSLVNGQCTCLAGTFQLGVKCILCAVGCSSCANTPSNCNGCVTPFQLVNTACVCPDGNFAYNQTCLPCVAGCTSCTDSGSNCQSCQTSLGFSLLNNKCLCLGTTFLLNGQCVACGTGCVTCSRTSTNCQSCLAAGNFELFRMVNCVCKNNWVLFNNVCTICNPECATCFTPANCLSCKLPYEFVGAGCDCGIGYSRIGTICVPCAQGCATCMTTASNCLTCLETFVLSSANSCVCGSGTFLQGASCTVCGLNCKTCQSFTNCTTCLDGYSLNGQCLSQCPPNYYSDTVTGKCTPCSSDCPSQKISWIVFGQYQTGNEYVLQLKLNGTLPTLSFGNINAETFGLSFIYPNGSFTNRTINSVTYLPANQTLNLVVLLNSSSLRRVLQAVELFYPQVRLKNGNVFPAETTVVNLRSNFNFVPAAQAAAITKDKELNTALGIVSALLILLPAVALYLLGHNTVGMVLVGQLLLLNYLSTTPIPMNEAAFYEGIRVLCFEFVRPLASLFTVPPNMQDSFYTVPSILNHGLLALLINLVGMVLGVLAWGFKFYVVTDSLHLSVFDSEEASPCFLTSQLRRFRWRLLAMRGASLLMLFCRLPVIFFSLSTLYYLPNNSVLNKAGLAVAALALALQGLVFGAGFVLRMIKERDAYLLYHPLETPNFCEFVQASLISQFDLLVQFTAGLIFAFRISGLLRLFVIIMMFLRESIAMLEKKGLLRRGTGVALTILQSVFVTVLVVTSSPIAMFVLSVLLAAGHIGMAVIDERQEGDPAQQEALSAGQGTPIDDH
jgi:hypothetical protein